VLFHDRPDDQGGVPVLLRHRVSERAGIVEQSDRARPVPDKEYDGAEQLIPDDFGWMAVAETKQMA